MSILEKIDMNQFIVCSRREKKNVWTILCKQSVWRVFECRRTFTSIFFFIRFAESGENRLNTLKTDLSDRDELKWKTVKTY